MATNTSEQDRTGQQCDKSHYAGAQLVIVRCPCNVFDMRVSP